MWLEGSRIIYRPDGGLYWALIFHLLAWCIISVYCFYIYFKQRKKK